MKIIVVHLLNDFSGSPCVLREAVKSLVAAGNAVTLVTSDGRGFLTDIPRVRVRTFHYARDSKGAWRQISFIAAQLSIFKLVISEACPGDTVYVNTLLPMAAVLAGWLRCAKVFVHLHETTTGSEFFDLFSKLSISCFCGTIICVSQYLANSVRVRSRRIVIPNFTRFVYNEASTFEDRDLFTMACSLKWYKGVDQFVELARAMQDLARFRFRLHLNCSEAEERKFLQKSSLPPNIEIIVNEFDLSASFRRSLVVINLSQRSGWIETFGLTLIEGMTFGAVPVAPNIGGPAEFIVDDVNGFLVDEADTGSIAERIRRLAASESIWAHMSEACRTTALSYSKDIFGSRIVEVFRAGRYAQAD